MVILSRRCARSHESKSISLFIAIMTMCDLSHTLGIKEMRDRKLQDANDKSPSLALSPVIIFQNYVTLFVWKSLHFYPRRVFLNISRQFHVAYVELYWFRWRFVVRQEKTSNAICKNCKMTELSSSHCKLPFDADGLLIVSLIGKIIVSSIYCLQRRLGSFTD